MKFYLFRQNNSGGWFVIDDTKGIGPCVWIEAASAEAANIAAERIGLYFDGSNRGKDYPWYDRWYPTWEPDGYDRSDIILSDYDFYWHDTVYLHHADGTIERVLAGERK